MEIHQLHYVDLVATEGSFTAASRRARVSQSALSTQVAKLETELGHRLFERGRHGAVLTDAGALLIERIRAALLAVESVSAAAAELSGVVVGPVALGAVVGCDLPEVAAGMAGFARAHPRATVAYAEGPSDALVASLQRGSLDLVLVGHAEPLPAGIVVTTVMSSDLVVVMPATAARRHVRVADLTDGPLVTLPPGTGVRSALDAAARRAGVTVRPEYEVHSSWLALDLVRRGAGLGVLTGGMLASTPAGLATVPLQGGGTSHLSLAHRRNPTPATAALSAALVEEFRGPGGL